MKEASKLHNFETSQEMEAYVKSTIEIHQRPVCGFEPMFVTRGGVVNDTLPRPVATTMPMATVAPTMANTALESNDMGAKNASTTNLQERDVDEADIVKHDGTNIFYTTRKYNQNSYVNITTFKELSKGNSKPMNQITFDKNQYL